MTRKLTFESSKFEASRSSRLHTRPSLAKVTAALAPATHAVGAMESAVAAAQAGRCPDYTWVGIYLLDGNELVLGPFVGKPSPHTRIPLGRGICGAAATEKATIIVDDVNADPRYLACSIETQSEIVVPIMRGARRARRDRHRQRPSRGVRPGRIARLLEAVAALLAPRSQPGP